MTSSVYENFSSKGTRLVLVSQMHKTGTVHVT